MTRVEHIGAATLYLGDCREILQSLAFDAIASDPPYGIKHRRGAKRESVHRGTVISRAPAPIIGDDRPFDPSHLLRWPCILWGAVHYCNHIPPASGSWLIWDKSGGVSCGDRSDAEIAWCSHKGATRTYRHMWMGVRRDSEQAQSPVHPTQKPVALMAWSIAMTRAPAGATICDPYMGSGTTGVAAVTRGFGFIGIEIDPDHFDTACRRIDEAQRQGQLFGDAA